LKIGICVFFRLGPDVSKFVHEKASAPYSQWLATTTTFSTKADRDPWHKASENSRLVDTVIGTRVVFQRLSNEYFVEPLQTFYDLYMIHSIESINSEVQIHEAANSLVTFLI